MASKKGKHLQDNPNHWSDIVGMPDKWDKENLTTLIKNFEKEVFEFTDENGTLQSNTGKDWIEFEVADAKVSHEQNANPLNEYGIKSKDSDMRIATAIPNVLWARIGEAYPTIFKDKKHLEWFIKNFPQFQVSQKY